MEDIKIRISLDRPTLELNEQVFSMYKGDKGDKGDNGDKGDKGDTGATGVVSVSETGSGNAYTGSSYDGTNKEIVFTKGKTFQEEITQDNKLDYSLISNTPTIPTVNDGTLTIQKNGTTIATFTANSNSNVTANIEADTQLQADWNQTNTSAADYIKNKPTIPSKTSDLNNDSGFIINTVNNLTNYYLKSETYTQAEVNSLVAAIKTIKAEIVAELPTADATTYFNTSKTIYMVANSSQSGNNYYDEYITIRSGTEGSYVYSWENIGSTQIDLSNYVQKTFTIAGVDLQDNITKSELLTALNVEDGAEVNAIESVSAGGVALTPDANGNVDIPDAANGVKGVIKLGDNASGFVNNAYVGLMLREPTLGDIKQPRGGAATQQTILLENIPLAVKYALCGADRIGYYGDVQNTGSETNKKAISMTLEEQVKAQEVLGITVLTGNSAPTTSTAGYVGQLYKDTTNNNIYICEGITTENNTTTYTWTQLIRITDKANNDNFGVVRLAQGRGLDLLSDGRLFVDVAGDVQITNRTVGRPLSTERINFAVLSALTDENHLTMTTTQQQTAQSVLGLNFGIARLG